MDYIILAMFAVLVMAGCAFAVMAGYGKWLMIYLILLLSLCWRAWWVGDK